jgi:uncharacterized protein YjiS (DUF1127 family)
MQSTCDQPRHPAAHPVGWALARAVGATLGEWRRRDRSRRELAALDDCALRDLGLDRTNAAFESGKSFLSR